MEYLSLPEGYQARKVRGKNTLVIVKIITKKVAPVQPKEKKVVVGRPTAEYVESTSRCDPGELVWSGKGEGQRILTCLTCEYAEGIEDMGHWDGGYILKLGNPTEEEKDTDGYRKMVADLAKERADEVAREAEAEAGRQAYKEECEANGEEPNWLDEFFAGVDERSL